MLPLPAQPHPLELARVDALRRYHVLDTDPEPAFDQLTRLAAYVCQTPMALISLIDTDRQWFKARLGIDVCSTDREVAFCEHAVRAGRLLVVPDTLDDPRFAANPLVQGEPHLRFYAGAPLITPDGQVLGTLCVLDTVPRELSDQQLDLLQALAAQTMTLLEHRRQAECLAEGIAETQAAQALLDRTRRELDGVLANTDVMVYAKDLDGRYLLANDSLGRVIGRRNAEILGRNDFDLFPRKVAEAFRRNDQQVALTGDRRVFEERAPHPDGTEHSYLSTRFPLFDADAQVYAVGGVSTDVTELAAARAAMGDSAERWRSLVEHSPVAVAVYGADDLRFRYANPVAAELYGATDPAELVGRSYLEVVQPSDRRLYLQSVARVLDGEPVLGRQVHMRRMGGELRAVEIYSAAVSYDGEAAVQVELRDVSVRAAADEAVRASESRFRSIFTGAPVGIAEMLPDGTVTAINDWVPRMLGYTENELVGHSIAAVTHPDDRAAQARQMADLPETSSGYLAKRVFVRKDGTPMPVLVSVSVVRDAAGAPERVLAMAVDVSELAASEQALEQAHLELRESAAFHDAVLAASPDLIFVVDPRSGAAVWSSRNLVETLGYTEGELVRLGTKVIEQLVHPDDEVRVRAANSAALDLGDGEVLQIRYRARHANGDYRWMARRVTPFSRGDDAEVSQLLGIARDITDIVEVEERLQEAALHDSLTGLPNRRLLADRLRQALSRSGRTGLELAVLFCDLDGFKHVNDTGGHAVGDQVLVACADRLRAVMRAEDSVARVGGDEFVILVEPGHRREDRAAIDVYADALAVAERIMAAISVPFVVGDVNYVVTASIGVTFAHSASDPDEILRDADTAMYCAKSRGKDRHEVFDGALRADAVERGRIERVLRTAVTAAVAGDAGRTKPGAALTVAYQPIFDLETSTVIGVEALARLHDSQGLPIEPELFVRVAEENGLIAPLGGYVLGVACQDLARWRDGRPERAELGVSVNLSARQAGLVDLVAQVKQTLALCNLPPRLLTLELTESVLLEAGRSTMSALKTLHEYGVAISIDDFGTGFASLRYVAQLPVSSVKIDRSFTAGLPHDPVSATIVRAIVGLASDLDLGCIVEGIETQEQLDALPEGLAGQGFLLAQPMSADAIEALLS